VSHRRTRIPVPAILVALLVAAAAGAQPVQEEPVSAALTGKVIAIDAKAGTLTVRSAFDETAVFRVEADTTIMSGSQEVPLSGLHEGEWVAVDANRKGDERIATYLEVVDDPGADTPPVASEPTPAGAKVVVGHNRLDPPVVQLGAGQTVTFHNVDKMPGGHTVVADDGSFSSPPLDKDQSWSHSFDVPGVYGIHIKEHPGTTASIVVGSP